MAYSVTPKRRVGRSNRLRDAKGAGNQGFPALSLFERSHMHDSNCKNSKCIFSEYPANWWTNYYFKDSNSC